MAATKYTKSLTTDFTTSHKFDSDRLTDELRASAIKIALDHIDSVGDAVDIWFKSDLDADDQAALSAVCAAHSGEPYPKPIQAVSVQQATVPVQSMPASGLKANQISMRYNDRTTWWPSAKPVVAETATTTDPDRKVWNLAHQNVIDVYHGKITGERGLSEMRVAVVVGSTVLAEQDPHYGQDGDFTVDYAAGTITLAQAAPAGQDPVVSYYREDGSLWIIPARSGETWKLKGAECQFSEDIELRDSLVYEIWIDDPANPGQKIQAVSGDYYITMYDYINDANRAYPAYPPLGGTGWRGSKKSIYVFSWDFQTVTDLYASMGMELRVYLEHNEPFGGDFATGTFYFIRTTE